MNLKLFIQAPVMCSTLVLGVKSPTFFVYLPKNLQSETFKRFQIRITNKMFFSLASPVAFVSAAIGSSSPEIEYPIQNQLLSPVIVAANSLSFVILGDWGSDRNIAGETQNAKAMASKTPDFVVTTGDNFYYNGTQSVDDPKWKQLWLDIYTPAIPWFPVLGNHDWYGFPESQIHFSKVNENWNLPYYYSVRTFKFGVFDAVFIFVDTSLFEYGYNGNKKMPTNQFLLRGYSQQNGTMEKQLKWIETQLNESRHEDYVFVVGHHPLGTCINKTSKGMQSLDLIVKKYQPTAYLSGHIHNLQFSCQKSANMDGVAYVTSGAGQESEDPMCDGALFHNNSTLGFVHATVDGNSGNVVFDFLDSFGGVLWSANVRSRSKRTINVIASSTEAKRYAPQAELLKASVNAPIVVQKPIDLPISQLLSSSLAILADKMVVLAAMVLLLN